MHGPERLAQDLSLPPPEAAGKAVPVLSLIEHPRVDMPAEHVNELFDAVARIVMSKLERPENDYGAKNSLIALAHEVMAETSWTRADVETAMRLAYANMGVESRVDSFEMRIREQ